MKKTQKYSWLFAAALLFAAGTEASAQSYTVRPDGAAVTTAPTEKDALYRITVRGTVALWNDGGSCNTLDALYLYDVPQSEINRGQWPPRKKTDVDSVLFYTYTSLWGAWNTLPELLKESVRNSVPVFPSVVYVGDSTNWYIPPQYPELGINEEVRLSMVQHVGLRINGAPMPRVAFDATSHRYTMEIRGTGEPLSFAVLDSIYSRSAGRTVARYEENCGAFTVDLEKISLSPGDGGDIDICDLTPIKDEQGKTIAVKLKAKILVEDTSSATGRLNILKEKSGQLAVIHNNNFIDCSAELECNNVRDTSVTSSSDPVSVCFVLDRSSSMMNSVSPQDTITKRWEAAEDAVSTFLTKMGSNDEGSLMFFDGTVSTPVNWQPLDNKGKGLIIDAIANTYPRSETALYNGIIAGSNLMSSAKSPRKILMVLSDGAHQGGGATLPQASSHLAQTYSGEVYFVALGLDTLGNEQDRNGLNALRQIAKDQPKAKVLTAYSSTELTGIFEKVSISTQTEECCTFFFDVPPCTGPNDKEHTIRIVYTVNGEVRERTITYPTECATTP